MEQKPDLAKIFPKPKPKHMRFPRFDSKNPKHCYNRGTYCSVEGCKSIAKVKGVCMKHYKWEKKDDKLA